MNRRVSFAIILIGFWLSSLLLGSCARQPAGGTPTPPTLAFPSVDPARTATPSFAPSPPRSREPLPTSMPEPDTAPTEVSAAELAAAEYTVQKGDTLLGIARTYGVPMAAVQLRNGMGDSTVVQVGQTLSIPSGAGWEEASVFWVVHVVREGETLVGIARTYGLKAERLNAANDLADADLIRVGQELLLPLDGPVVAQAPAPTGTPVPPPSPTPVPPVDPTTAPSSPASAPAAPPPANVADWPRETVRLINEVRAQHGLPPLAYNETLARAAQGQANDCAQRGWCSHTGSDGSDIKARVIRAGYQPASWAECWAQRQTPQGAVDIWMDEIPPNDPHRRTLLTTWLSEIGVGVAQTTWGYYFIADFGRP